MRHACTHTDIHACPHTGIQAYIDIDTHIHRYMHTYIMHASVHACLLSLAICEPAKTRAFLSWMLPWQLRSMELFVRPSCSGCAVASHCICAETAKLDPPGPMRHQKYSYHHYLYYYLWLYHTLPLLLRPFKVKFRHHGPENLHAVTRFPSAPRCSSPTADLQTTALAEAARLALEPRQIGLSLEAFVFKPL